MTRMNVTGRPITISTPLKDDTTALGEVLIRINPDDSILVSKIALAQQLATVVNDLTLADLAAVRSRDGFCSIADLSDAGLSISFDPALQELRFLPQVDQRTVRSLAIGGARTHVKSANAAKPASFSGYVNVIVGADHLWNASNDRAGTARNGASSAYVELEPVVRWRNVVLENKVLYDGAVDTNTCPSGAICTYEHAAGIKRRSSRLVYDIPGEHMRLGVGDVIASGTRIQRTPELLGIAFEKSARKLNPADIAEPMGRGSFRVEHPSDVDIVVNGNVLQRVRLAPGNYDVRDLPLAGGLNEIEIVVTDDTGYRRTVTFSSFYDRNRLRAGTSEWALSGGVPSYTADNDRAYYDDLYIGSGFFRYGVTDALTVEASLQGDNEVVLAGLGSAMQTPWGTFEVNVAASRSGVDLGGALDLSWSLANFSALTSRRGESARIAAEFRSVDFRTPGEHVRAQSGVFYPEWDYWLKLDASYSLPLDFGVTATISGRYAFVDADQDFASPYHVNGDRHGAELTLSRQLSPSISASLSMGVTNEPYLFGNVINDDTASAFHAILRLYVRADDQTSLAASYDTHDAQAAISGYWSGTETLDRWDASFDLQRNGFSDGVTGNTSLGYYGNRAEMRLTQTSGAEGFDLSESHQRTGLRLGSSIAFADGHVGIGAPIRGGAFALVYPHESIAGKDIAVGNGGNIQARADGWGPAVVTNLPAYAPNTILVDVADLPIGYSLGAGTFDIHAPYHAGYALEVGSAFSVSAYGRLVSDTGQPVALATGTIRPAGGSGQQMAIFTNADGRFGAEGLAPGDWIIEMATDERSAIYAVKIPAGADNLYRAGTLIPVSIR